MPKSRGVPGFPNRCPAPSRFRRVPRNSSPAAGGRRPRRSGCGSDSWISANCFRASVYNSRCSSDPRFHVDASRATALAISSWARRKRISAASRRFRTALSSVETGNFLHAASARFRAMTVTLRACWMSCLAESTSLACLSACFCESAIFASARTSSSFACSDSASPDRECFGCFFRNTDTADRASLKRLRRSLSFALVAPQACKVMARSSGITSTTDRCSPPAVSIRTNSFNAGPKRRLWRSSLTAFSLSGDFSLPPAQAD